MAEPWDAEEVARTLAAAMYGEAALRRKQAAKDALTRAYEAGAASERERARPVVGAGEVLTDVAGGPTHECGCSFCQLALALRTYAADETVLPLVEPER